MDLRPKKKEIALEVLQRTLTNFYCYINLFIVNLGMTAVKSMDSYFDHEIMIIKQFWGMRMNIECADLSKIFRFSID